MPEYAWPDNTNLGAQAMLGWLFAACHFHSADLHLTVIPAASQSLAAGAGGMSLSHAVLPVAVGAVLQCQAFA
jgi:hypothetical protein